MNLLVVEDDQRVADFLSRGLEAEGYRVRVARTGTEGVELGQSLQCDVIILDLLLPEIHGIEVCSRLRDAGVITPILMLTALGTTEDRIEGLRVGADDYLVKPFAFEELLARIAALIRRSRHFETPSSTVRFADVVFDRETLVVTRGDRKIDLTAKELAILDLLLSQPGKVFSRALVLSKVWGYDSDPLTNIVDVYIARLRRKIDAPGAPELISTVRGYGYKLDIQPAAQADAEPLRLADRE